MKLKENKFQYPDLQRVENELGRFYLDSKGQEVPSVTNVLSSTSDQSGICLLYTSPSPRDED